VLSGKDPMVSFTFDDIPDSAANVGAPMLEEYGGLPIVSVAEALRRAQAQSLSPSIPKERRQPRLEA
jgi:hypothetical protein